MAQTIQSGMSQGGASGTTGTPELEDSHTCYFPGFLSTKVLALPKLGK